MSITKAQNLSKHLNSLLNLPPAWVQWFDANMSTLSKKIDAVIGGTVDNFPQLEADGSISDSGKAKPQGEVVGTTDQQTLTQKTLEQPIVDQGTFNQGTFNQPNLVTPTITDFTNAQHQHHAAVSGGTLDEASLVLSDVTTNDVTNAKHGFFPKPPTPADLTKFWRQDLQWGAIDLTAYQQTAEKETGSTLGGSTTAYPSSYTVQQAIAGASPPTKKWWPGVNWWPHVVGKRWSP